MADRIEGMSIGLGMDSSEISRSMSEVKRSFKGLNSEAKVTSNNFRHGTKDANSYRKTISSLTDTTDKQRKNVEDLGKRYTQTVEEQGASSKAAQNLATEYNKQADNLNRLENQLDGVQQEFKEFTKQQNIADSNFTKMGNSMEKNGQRLQTIGGGMQKAGGIFTKASAAVVGGAAGVSAGLYGLTNKATEAADAIAKGSERMGISTDFYQEMDFWASQNGLSQESMEKAVGRLNQRMGQAVDGNDKYASALQALGVDLKGVEDGSVSTEDAMATSVQTLSEMENENEKAALATDLFGTRMARDLLPALNDGSLSMEDAKKKAEELGLVMNEGQLEDAEAFQDAQDQIKRSMGAVATQIGLDLMPHFQKMFDWVLENMPTIRDNIMNAFEGAVDSVKSIMDWWGELSDTMKRIIPTVAGLALAFGPVLLALGSVASAIGSVMTVVAPLFTALGKLSGTIKTLGGILPALKVAFAAINWPITLIVAGIAALATGFTVAYNKSESFRNFIQGLGERFSQAISWIGKFKDGILRLFSGDGMEGVDILTSIGLSEGMAGKLQGIADKFIQFKDRVVGIIDNIKNGFKGVVAFFQGDLGEGVDLLRSIGLSDETIETIFSIVQNIRTKFHELKLRVNLAIRGIGDFFKSIFNDIKVWWDENGQSILDAVSRIFEGMKTTVSTVMQVIGTAVKGAINLITSIFNTFAPIVMGIWDMLWPVMLTVVQNVWEKIKFAIGVATDLITGIISAFSAIINGDWSQLWEIIRETAASIMDRIVTLIDGMRQNAIDLIQRLAGGAIQWFQDMWSNLTQKATDIKDVVILRFKILRAQVISKIINLVGTVGKWFIDLYNDATRIATNIKDGVVDRFNQVKDGVIDRVTNLYNSVTNWFSDLWTYLKIRVQQIKQNVIMRFRQMKNTVIRRVTELYNSVKSWFQDIYDNVTTKISNAKDKVIGFATDMKDGAIDKFNNLADGARDMMDKVGEWIDEKKQWVVDKATDLGTSIANSAIDGFNKMIGGVNDVAELLGFDGNLISEIPTYSTGTNRHGGGMAIVGDKGPGNGGGGSGKPNNQREIVKTPGGGSYLFEDETLIPNLPKGSKVFNNKDTEGMIGGSGSDEDDGLFKSIGDFAKDTFDSAKETVSGAYSSVKGFVSDVWDYAKEPGKLVSDMMGNLDFGWDLPEKALEFAKLGVNKLKDTATDFISNLFEESGGQGDGSHVLGKDIYQTFGKYSGGLSFNDGNHYGVDTAHIYDKLLSPISGVITKIWDDYGGGNSIQIKSGELNWWFMHMKNIAKQVGDSVKVGDNLGTTGNTGNFTTAPHLHTQVMEGGVGNSHAIDPVPVLEGLSGYATGGLVGDGIYRLGEEGYPEWVIPTDPSRSTEAMKLLALAGKSIQGNNKRPNQLPNVGSQEGDGIVEKLTEIVSNQQQQLDELRQQTAQNDQANNRISQAINYLAGIESKTGFQPGRAKRAMDKYNDDRTILT